MDKKTLRKNFKALRAAFAEEVRAEADRRIKENFFAHFGGYGSYFVYNSFGTEADTKGIIAALLSQKKRVYLPRVEGKDMVAVPYGGALKLSGTGIEEPVGEPFEGSAEVTVIPLLAIDGNGCRLGYGGGFYDRYLADKHTLKVGIGYGFQFTEENFKEEWDIPLNAFVSDAGISFFGR